jgi:hypothetical protein
MVVQRRSILGPVNPLDNGQPAVTQTGGGTDALDRGPGYVEPLSVKTGDMQSVQTSSERANLEASFRSAQRAAAGDPRVDGTGRAVG